MSYDCSTQQFWEQDPLFTNTGATISQLIERIIQPYCSDILDKHPREIAYFAFKRAHETLGHISVQHYHLDEERFQVQELQVVSSWQINVSWALITR